MKDLMNNPKFLGIAFIVCLILFLGSRYIGWYVLSFGAVGTNQISINRPLIHFLEKTMKNLKLKASQALAVATMAVVPFAAYADGGDPLAEIGNKVGTAISAFIGVVSAIGLASITVIVAIQGFKLAWGMIKTIK